MKKRIAMLFCCLCMLGLSQQVHAREITELPSLVIEETGRGENVGDQYNSVLQIVVSFTDKENNEIPIQGGSGFLIGDDESKLQYVITTNEIVTVSDMVKEELVQTYQLDDVGAVKETIEVVISKDVTIEASVVTASEEMDFAILQLRQPLHDRQALLFNDKESETYLEKAAFVLGYPGAVGSGRKTVYYTVEDLQKIEGFLETEEIINGQKYVKHHIFPNYGNLGGPILDENGDIVALNQAKNDGKNFYALEIAEIIRVMDSLGLPYKTVSQAEAEEAAALAAIVHKEELNHIIAEAEKLDLSEYKKKTTTDFAICLEEVKEVQENVDATQEEVDNAVEKMQETISVLVPKTPIKIVLAIVGGCVLLVVVVILIVLRATRQVRMERRAKKKAEFTVTEPAPVFEKPSPLLETSYKDLVRAGNRQVSNHNIWNVQMDEQEENAQAVTLINCRNCENILVHKFPFVIGKDKIKTDYYVQNNPAVSRIHATIVFEKANYYVQDINSTNGTFVNGERLEKGKRVLLHNGDKIMLGNEEFDFKMLR